MTKIKNIKLNLTMTPRMMMASTLVLLLVCHNLFCANKLYHFQQTIQQLELNRTTLTGENYKLAKSNTNLANMNYRLARRNAHLNGSGSSFSSESESGGNSGDIINGGNWKNGWGLLDVVGFDNIHVNLNTIGSFLSWLPSSDASSLLYGYMYDPYMNQYHHNHKHGHGHDVIIKEKEDCLENERNGGNEDYNKTVNSQYDLTRNKSSITTTIKSIVSWPGSFVYGYTYPALTRVTLSNE
eukprot:727381_1